MYTRVQSAFVGAGLETRIKIHCTCEKILISPPRYNPTLRLDGIGSRSSRRLFVPRDRCIQTSRAREILDKFFTAIYRVDISRTSDCKYSRSDNPARADAAPLETASERVKALREKSRTSN